MIRRGRYSQETKLAVLARLDRNGGNYYLTAKEAGIAWSTLSKWVKDQHEGRLPMLSPRPEPFDEKASLADQLGQIVGQMVAIMPEKVEEASLQELTRSLTSILATMNQVRAETEAKEDDEIYERLVRHLSQYAPDGAESCDVSSPAESPAD